jgi:hypothetical protein
MPSQINNAGNVGYGLGTDVSANYLVTKPSTRFATRQLAFFEVNLAGVSTNPYLTDSVYSRAVRAIQQNAEIYAVGEPNSTYFMVVVAQDTANDGDNTDDGLNEMAKTLSTVTGGTVTAKHLHGAGFASGLRAYSDESQADSFDGFQG